MSSSRLPHVLILSLLLYGSLPAQATDPGFSVNEQGRIVTTSDGTEIRGFGVNYTLPFAHAFRAAGKMGLDVREQIDRDVYHFARLGFDLFRVHVWDVEISDTKGNLLKNAQLDHFDYLLKQLSERGIRYVLTPIAYWGNGWPEPDEKLPGFSSVFGKSECLTNPDCIEAQENYLYQFMNHVNPYTGFAYKNDPNLIAVEISNEPHHRGNGKEVTAFVKRMLRSVQRSGNRKPVFYNISHGVHFAADYFRAGIDGGTFQWYPTGLGYQKELPGNALLNVDRYPIPFDSIIGRNSGAKIVYEFDAADVMDAHVYPAMARSFREAGIQLATHFAYDPTFLAPYNTEYNTHYMNLAYTPSKALALAICSRIFHEIPIYSSFGRYPENTRFGHTTLDPENGLAVYNSPDTFIYTGDTQDTPLQIKKLESLKGVGSSPVVKYTGSGAYFLDRVQKGIWRLEIMPDPGIYKNPFGRNSTDRQLAGLRWDTNEITVDLRDLGSDFDITKIDRGKAFEPSPIDSRTYRVYPGTYLLTRAGKSNEDYGEKRLGAIRMDEFFAPEKPIPSLQLNHQPPLSAPAGSDLTLQAGVFDTLQPMAVTIHAYPPGQGRVDIHMESTDGFHYRGKLKGEGLMGVGRLNYFISITRNSGEVITFPAGVSGVPGEWDFEFDRHYRTEVLNADAPVLLFDAYADYDNLIRTWRPEVRLIKDPLSHGGVLEVNPAQLWRPDSENLDASPIYDYSIKHPTRQRTRSWKDALGEKSSLAVEGRSLNGKPCKVQIGLTQDNGHTYAALLELTPEKRIHRISLAELKPVPTVLLPRPYPTFLPYFFESAEEPGKLQLNRMEALQISLGPGLSDSQRQERNGYALSRVWLE